MSQNFQVDKEKLKQLTDFGVPPQLAYQALAFAKNDINKAGNIIYAAMSSKFVKLEPEPAPKNSKGELICIACKNEEKTEGLIDFGCGHPMCSNCFTQYLDSIIIKKNRSYICIKCPWENCEHFIPLDITKNHLSEKAKQIVDEKIKMLPDISKLEERVPNNFCFKLSDFGYEYNEKQELRNIKDGSKYYYVNEKQYNAMGDAIVGEIQTRMKDQFKLKEIFLDEKKECNIFLSEKENDKLLLLIQGSGAVRAGQWARALCFNESLHTGAQLDYIEQALNEKYDVIVFNPNLNEVRKVPQLTKERFDWTDPEKPGPLDDDEEEKIQNSESTLKHTLYVYDNFVKNSKHKKLFIVAHSAGGYHCMRLLRNRKEILKRLVAIGFTDSVHSLSKKEDEEIADFVTENAIQWARSKEPLDTLLTKKGWRNCTELSAGHTRHENTSASCQKSLFKFFQKKDI